MTLYRPQQTTMVQQTDWTNTITSLLTAIMPVIVMVMMFKMITPMMEGLTR